jgi:hypothetical protein
LSLVSAARAEKTSGMVLWDTVIDGRAYVQSLKEWHASSIASGAIPMRPRHHLDDTHTEILGYPFSAKLLDEITGINPLAIERAPADRILVVDAGDDAAAGPLREHLQRLGASVVVQNSAAPRVWRQEPYQAVIPHEVLTNIVAWIAEVFE